MPLRLTGLLLCLMAAFAAPAAAQASADVVLRPGDAIRISVWREQDLSGDFPVDETGHVILPMLGSVTVAGRTVAQVREELLAGYARQLRNPSITVVPMRRVNVLGEVIHPGIFTVDPTVALSDLLAMAGGAAPSGDPRRIRLVRDGQVLTERLEPGVALTSMDVRSGDQIFVGRRSWMDRNSAVVVSTILSAVLSVTASIILTQ
jgi:protein involved in polysaccharide export with SLBB domain